MSNKFTITCPVFDGEKVYESATVTVENDIITGFEKADGANTTDCLLMPGLIDGHVHINNSKQIKQFTDCGVTTVCDVSVSKEIKSRSDTLNIHTSYTMALGNVDDGKSYVEKAVAIGADYVKIILEKPARMANRTMPQDVLQDIVNEANARGMKTIAHAVCVPTMEMAVEAGVDILLHTPMKEKLPLALARQIKAQSQTFMPTLIMMKKFTTFPFGGYKKEDYQNAIESVKRLHSIGVPILAGTDANAVIFVPQVKHGVSLFDEMELMSECDISPVEILQSATSRTADAFCMNHIGRITVGKKADLVLINGRPDKNISDIRKIHKVLINGKAVR